MASWGFELTRQTNVKSHITSTIIMQLSEELKTSASLANSLNDQVYKQLIKLCFLELLKEDSVEDVRDLYNSKPDVVKEVHWALVSLVAKFARHNLDTDGITELLTRECGYAQNRVEILTDMYSVHKANLQVILGNIGTHLPHIIDVKWTMDYTLKTSNLDETKGPIFRVHLIVETYDDTEQVNKIKTVDFSCDTEELQDLVHKLKDASRHCHRIATER